MADDSKLNPDRTRDDGKQGGRRSYESPKVVSYASSEVLKQMGPALAGYDTGDISPFP